MAAEKKRIAEEALALKRATEEAAALKRATEEAAALKRAAEEAAALKRVAEEKLALKKAVEDEAASKRAEEEAAKMKRVVEEAALVLGNLSGMDHTSPRAVLSHTSSSFSMVIPDSNLVTRSPLLVRLPSETSGYSEVQNGLLNSERSMTPLRFY